MSDSMNLSGDLLAQTGGAPKAEGGPQVLPAYLVIDESSSMSGASMKAVNDGIVKLFDGIIADPIVDALVRVGIVAFNDTARVVLPLTQLSDVTQIPVCVASGSTSYAAAFRLLKSQIESDIPNLQQTFVALRPIVFFVSAGCPDSENWRDELAKLVDPFLFKFSPNIVSFGVAGAEKTVIAEVAYQVGKTGAKVFVMAEDAEVTFGVAFLEFILLTKQFEDVVYRWGGPGIQNLDGSVLGGARVHVIDPESENS